MLKKINHFALACALALPAAPALAEYEALCLHNTGGYTAGFRVEVVKRGVSPAGAGRIIHQRSFYKGDGGDNAVLSAQTKCVSLERAGVRPGDGVRFLVDPFLDIGNRATRTCGPFKNRRRDFEGFFLIPDGPRDGRLTFKSWGHLYGPACELQHDGERMHSACGATEDGMQNAGCNPFELDQDSALGERPGRQVPDAIDQNATIGQFVDLLDRARFDVNQTRPDGSSGLHAAARGGLGAHLDALVARGADLNLRDAAGRTPLMLALAERRFGMMDKLLTAGANPNLDRDDGDFPLRLAAEQGGRELVERLLESGALANARHARTGESALDAAKARRDIGRDEVVAALRAGGAEDRIYLEEIPNIIATDAGADELRGALARGEDVDQSTGDGLTGLHVAALMNSGEYAGILIENGANVNLRDDQGRTPLMTAIEADPDYPEVVQSLLYDGEERVDLDAPRRDGKFPLYLAAEMAREDIIDMLLYYADDDEFDINQRRDGQTALGLTHELIERGSRSEHLQIQQALLNRNASR